MSAPDSPAVPPGGHDPPPAPAETPADPVAPAEETPRRRRRRRRFTTELVRPDVPAYPILVVCFLLFAYLVGITRNAPTEGSLPWLMAKEGRDPDAFLPVAERPIDIIVTVEAGGAGTIGNMTVRETGDPAGEVVGASIGRYQAELKKRRAALGARQGELILEIGDHILYEYVVRLLDVGIVVGFESIHMVPADERKR